MKQINYEKNQIIAYFDRNGRLVVRNNQKPYIYRKYLGESAEGYFLIQDFYNESHNIYSNEININDARGLYSVVKSC